MTWQLIETALKDGTPVDLWCVDPAGEFVPERGGIRLTDCYWSMEWVRSLEDGHLDLIEGPPSSVCGLPPWKPTHWMLPPEPPE